VCMGTLNFGPETSEPDSHAVMDHAHDRGVNFFDTSNVYGWKRGEGWTEQIIGRWLAQGGGRRERTVLGTKVYPGLEEALDMLSARGAKLGICTNKPERMTRLLIDALGWNDRFDSIVGADTLKVRKPLPLPLLEAIARAGGGRAAFVGDSITDADTARAADVPFVAVSFGFSDRPVDQLGADAVIDSYADLVGALERL